MRQSFAHMRPTIRPTSAPTVDKRSQFRKFEIVAITMAGLISRDRLRLAATLDAGHGQPIVGQERGEGRFGHPVDVHGMCRGESNEKGGLTEPPFPTSIPLIFS